MKLLRLIIPILCSVASLAAAEEQAIQYGLLTAKVPQGWTRQDLPHGGVQYLSPNLKGEGPNARGPVLLLKSTFVGENTMKELKEMSDRMNEARKAKIDKDLENEADKEKAADFAAKVKQSKVELSTRNGVECLVCEIFATAGIGEGRFKARASTIAFIKNRQSHVASLTVPLECLAEGEKEFQAILDSVALAPEQK